MVKSGANWLVIVCFMTRFERTANILAVLLPFLAFCAAVSIFWGHGVQPADLAVMAAM